MAKYRADSELIRQVDSSNIILATGLLLAIAHKNTPEAYVVSKQYLLVIGYILLVLC